MMMTSKSMIPRRAGAGFKWSSESVMMVAAIPECISRHRRYCGETGIQIAAAAVRSTMGRTASDSEPESFRI
jgi:hypothetical protein